MNVKSAGGLFAAAVIVGISVVGGIFIGSRSTVPNVTENATEQPAVEVRSQSDDQSFEGLKNAYYQNLGPCKDNDTSACDRMNDAEHGLRSMGFCFERAGQASFQYEWHRCDAQDTADKVEELKREVMDRQAAQTLVGHWSYTTSCETDDAVHYRADGTYLAGNDQSGTWNVEGARLIQRSKDGSTHYGRVEPVTINQFNVTWDDGQVASIFRCQ